MDTKSSSTIVKRVALGVIVAIVVAAGVTWYMLSGKTLAATQALIEKINAAPHADGAVFKITYDAITRTAFPTIGVRFVNPQIEFNSPGLPSAQPGAEAPAAAPQPLHVLWKHTGTTAIISDYFTHEYRFVTDGSGTGSLDSGEEKVSVNSAASHTELAIVAKDSAGFRQWQSLHLSDADALAKVFPQIGGLHLAVGATKLTDSTTGAVLMSQEKTTVDFVNRSEGKQINFDASLLSKGSEITKEYTDILVRVMTILRLPSSTFDGSMPLASSRAGKQDIDIAISANLPVTPRGQEIPNGEIHVTKFDIKNDFYHLIMPLDVVMQVDAEGRHAVIKLDWSLDISPTGAKETQMLIELALQQVPLPTDQKTANLRQQLREKLYAALPTVSTLGPITLALDAEAYIPKAVAPNTPAAKPNAKKEAFTLRQFSFGHKRWGIEAKGEARKDDAAQPGSVTGTLSCKQCTTLTQDLFETSLAVQDLVQTVEPGKAAFPLTTAMLTQLNTTLAEIGKPSAATGDLDFVLTTPAPVDIRVNDAPIGEAITKLQMVFVPPPPPAAAPAPAAPAVVKSGDSI